MRIDRCFARRLISTPTTRLRPSPVPSFIPHVRGQLLDCEVHQQFLTVVVPRAALPVDSLDGAAAAAAAAAAATLEAERHVTNGGDRKQPIRAGTSTRRRSLQISPPPSSPPFRYFSSRNSRDTERRPNPTAYLPCLAAQQPTDCPGGGGGGGGVGATGGGRRSDRDCTDRQGHR